VVASVVAAREPVVAAGRRGLALGGAHPLVCVGGLCVCVCMCVFGCGP
jgi:hypothetical protein